MGGVRVLAGKLGEVVDPHGPPAEERLAADRALHEHRGSRGEGTAGRDVAAHQVRAIGERDRGGGLDQSAHRLGEFRQEGLGPGRGEPDALTGLGHGGEELPLGGGVAACFDLQHRPHSPLAISRHRTDHGVVHSVTDRVRSGDARSAGRGDHTWGQTTIR